jgi:hypothetical protein
MFRAGETSSAARPAPLHLSSRIPTRRAPASRPRRGPRARGRRAPGCARSWRSNTPRSPSASARRGRSRAHARSSRGRRWRASSRDRRCRAAPARHAGAGGSRGRRRAGGDGPCAPASYRRRDRTRPIIGDRRPPSPLDAVQPDHWLPDCTTDLLDLLHVLGRLVALESRQADLLDRLCAGPLLAAEELREEADAGGVAAPQA